MAKSPVEKPTAEELRDAVILFSSHSKDRQIVRYRIGPEITQEQRERGHCVRLPKIVEVHVPDDGSPATWWGIYGE